MIKSKTKSDKFWEPIIDFTKIKKGGIGINHLLSRLFSDRKEKRYYL